VLKINVVVRGYISDAGVQSNIFKITLRCSKIFTNLNNNASFQEIFMNNVQYPLIENHAALQHDQDHHTNKHEYFYIP
jgi:hypothetical protein